jgi:hypothetical protein
MLFEIETIFRRERQSSAIRDMAGKPMPGIFQDGAAKPDHDQMPHAQ